MAQLRPPQTERAKKFLNTFTFDAVTAQDLRELSRKSTGIHSCPPKRPTSDTCGQKLPSCSLTHLFFVLKLQWCAV